MKEKKEEARQLQERGRQAVKDMNKVREDVDAAIEEMRVVADGLGSGVTPEQLNSSIELGERWLEDIRARDFSAQRTAAVERRKESVDLVDQWENL